MVREKEPQRQNPPRWVRPKIWKSCPPFKTQRRDYMGMNLRHVECICPCRSSKVLCDSTTGISLLGEVRVCRSFDACVPSCLDIPDHRRLLISCVIGVLVGW